MAPNRAHIEQIQTVAHLSTYSRTRSIATFPKVDEIVILAKLRALLPLGEQMQI